MIHGRYHAIAGGAMFVGLILGAIGAQAKLLDGKRGDDDDKGPDLQLKAIEVSVARPSQNKTRQPQKPHRDPVHDQSLKGLAHDDKAHPPDKKKPDDPKQKPDDDKDGPASTIKDDDNPVGKPVSDPGQFNPNKFGTDDVDRGDPYLQELKKDILQAGGPFPTIIQAKGTPLACLHVAADGTIADTLFKEKSGDGDVDQWVEGALKGITKDRKEHPQEVPARLYEQISGWICFHFDLSKQ